MGKLHLAQAIFLGWSCFSSKIKRVASSCLLTESHSFIQNYSKILTLSEEGLHLSWSMQQVCLKIFDEKPTEIVESILLGEFILVVYLLLSWCLGWNLVPFTCQATLYHKATPLPRPRVFSLKKKNHYYSSNQISQWRPSSFHHRLKKDLNDLNFKYVNAL